ncbi:MAG: hypothetical protein ACQ9ET_00215 [Nitrosomonadaceae bacterium]
MALPLINGRSYDFTQINLTIGGVIVNSVSAVTYTEEQEKVNNFGAGTNPVSRGHGAKNASASITISMNDVEAIRASALNGSLLSIDTFDIVVVYTNPQGVVTHTIKNCEFTNDGVEATVGDTDINRSFDLVASHVNYA